MDKLIIFIVSGILLYSMPLVIINLIWRANRIKFLEKEEKENSRLLSLLANHRDVGLKYTTYCSGLVFENGGYVYSLDIASIHPYSLITECPFSIGYTTAFRDIVERRINNDKIS